MYQKLDNNAPPGYMPQPRHNPAPAPYAPAEGQYPPVPAVPSHGPVVIDMLDLPEHPVQIKCPYCQTYTLSRTRTKCGQASTLWCIILAVFTLLCWLLPLLCLCKDRVHTCGVCGRRIGFYTHPYCPC
jgi:hypothetical protein